MPFTLSAPRSEVEPSRSQQIQRADIVSAANQASTTTNHYPRRRRNVFSTLTDLIQTNSMVRYGTLIFLVALISVLYFATTHQAIRPTDSGPTITSEYLTIVPNKHPNRSSDDGFPISEGQTEPFATFEAYGKGDVQQIAEGSLHNNTNKGIRGVLYDRGDGCQSIKFNADDSPTIGVVPSIPLPKVFTPYKISLISSDVTNCPLDQKIKLSDYDGDRAIIFHVESNLDEENLSALNSKGYTIPIFTINKSSGDNFISELKRLYQAKPKDDSLYKVIIVILKPYHQIVVNSWLFAMFAVGGILVASFFVSILIHMRLYRLRRNQQLEISRQRATDEVLGMKKWTLEKDIIDTFPIIIYDKKSGSISEEPTPSTESTDMIAQPQPSTHDNEDIDSIKNENDESNMTNRQLRHSISTQSTRGLHRSISTRSTRSTKSTRSLRAIINATNLYKSTSIPTTPTTPITPTNPTIPTTPTVATNQLTPTTPTHQTTTATTTIPANQTSLTAASASTDDDTDTCAICLDDFENGDEIRELPCKHWYHVECIDPWLTTKSSSCPLCKIDCRPKQNEEIIIDGFENQDSNNESDVNNVFARMGKVFGKLFGKRSISVRPADTRQQNDRTVDELEMESIETSRT
ncbi:17446_t:CDS:1 [Funneliformis geosporum]|uniref:11068_t:CDS:1 n=1 Tax=Funneliformis geosporum TaxID=1117311 RepID=A0A9W4SVP4_9GLOM|nr:17446_t:CDS:1 [Funneliformis geosporum]CAI2182279.1 11068_t:CDS:1 [Funneliformis geosporum]